jgi:protocatechuate 3,4-dioxygenase beta subunit
MAQTDVYSGPCIAAELPTDASVYKIEGRVIDDVTGSAIPGTKVSLTGICINAAQQAGSKHDALQKQAVTDRNGRFSFEGIPAGSFDIMPSHEGYSETFTFRRAANDPIRMFIVGPKLSSITLRLAPDAGLYGVVRDIRGLPMSDAWVTLWCYRTWGGWRRLEYCNTIKTESNGSYKFESLHPGKYYLVAQPEVHIDETPEPDSSGKVIGYVPMRAPQLTDNQVDAFFDLGEGQRTKVDFSMKPVILHHVSGTVAGGGQGTPIISFVDRNRSNSYYVKVSPGCCAFEAWVPSGRFTVSSQYASGDGEFVGTMPLQVADTDISEVVYTLSRKTAIDLPIEVSGAAPPNDPNPVCADTEASGGFWFLQLVALDQQGYAEAGPQSTMSGGVHESSDCRRESISVPPGTYSIQVAATNNAYAKSINLGGLDLLREPLTVRSGDAPNTIRVVLAEGVIAEGVTAYGTKAASAWVYAIPLEPEARPFQSTLSGHDGKFRIQGLAPGSYLFLATEVEGNFDIHDAELIKDLRAAATERTLATGAAKNLRLQIK